MCFGEYESFTVSYIWWCQFWLIDKFNGQSTNVSRFIPRLFIMLNIKFVTKYDKHYHMNLEKLKLIKMQVLNTAH